MVGDPQKTILLVEDEVLVAMDEKMALERNGYAVFTVNTGEKALDVFKRNSSIDLVLMDIDLGGGHDGPETAGLILKHREVPIVFLSGHTEAKVVKKIEKITSYGYVVKNSGDAVLDASIKMAFKLYDANCRLQESEEKFRSIVEQSMDGIVITDNKGDIEIWNESMSSITGIKEKTAIGSPLWKIISVMVPNEIKTSEFIEKLKEAARNILKAKIQWPGRTFEQEIVGPGRIRKIVQGRPFTIKTASSVRIGTIFREMPK